VVSVAVDECLIFCIGKKLALMFFRGAGLLELGAAFVDCCQGVEFVYCWVDAEVFARAEGEMF